MSIAPTEGELIARALESRIGDIFTSCPGIVKSYDPATQTADVLPAVKRAMPTESGDIIYEELPIVPNVKVCFPSGGPFAISWPISEGDSVILLTSRDAIGQWRRGDNLATVLPGDLRTHALGASFAIPMLAIDSRAIPENQANQNAFIVNGPMAIFGDPATAKFAAIAEQCDTNFSNIKALFDGWTVAPNDGGAALKTASAGLSLPSVACIGVKIK